MLRVALERMQAQRMPDFFVVGAAKAGTTALHRQLARQPALELPGLKEPRFFSGFPPGSPDVEVASAAEYLQLYRDIPSDLMTGDFSPTYLYTHQYTIPRLLDAYAGWQSLPLIILILREPLDRIWSQYNSFKKFEAEPLSLLEATSEKTIETRLSRGCSVFYDYLGFSRYARPLEAFVRHFPLVFVISQEELRQRPAEVIKRVCELLDVSFDSSRVLSDGRFNSSGSTRNALAAIVERVAIKPNLVRDSVKRLVRPARRYAVQNWLSGMLYERTDAPDALYQRWGTRYAWELEETLTILDEKKVEIGKRCRERIEQWRNLLLERA